MRGGGGCGVGEDQQLLLEQPGGEPMSLLAGDRQAGSAAQETRQEQMRDDGVPVGCRSPRPEDDGLSTSVAANPELALGRGHNAGREVQLHGSFRAGARGRELIEQAVVVHQTPRPW